MAGIDKAAIGWTIAIVAAGIGIALAGPGLESSSAPAITAPTVSDDKIAQAKETIAQEQQEKIKPTISGWDRAESSQDPGIGHETHQLAVLLAPSDNVYSGTLKYDASEPIQLVTLHGPLADGEDRGQPIWTPDGETKFALTLVDPKSAKGEWTFAGNALAVHTFNEEQFIVDYKIDYEETSMSDTVMTGTIDSVQDPGLGHENHQLAVILPPSEDTYSGILAYSASEPIQLVSLRGPVGADENPALTWTPDGTTIFELTFVDPKTAMGTWEFSGNALAVHTMFTNTFSVSYSVSADVTKAEKHEIHVEDEVHVEEEVPEPVEEAPAAAEPQTHMVGMPEGAGIPGCETTDTCYTPTNLTINAGDTVVWTNDEPQVPHTVTAGDLTADANVVGEDYPNGFDSQFMAAGATFEWTFDEAGTYPYFCQLHPWMVGTVQVN